MTKHLDDLGKLSAEVALVIRPLVDREVARRVGAISAQRTERAKSIETAIMEACARLADRVDGLQQAKFSGQREVAARRAVEKAAEAVAALMRRRDKSPVRDSRRVLGPGFGEG